MERKSSHLKEIKNLLIIEKAHIKDKLKSYDPSEKLTIKIKLKLRNKREEGSKKYLLGPLMKYYRRWKESSVVFSQCNRRANLWGLANS